MVGPEEDQKSLKFGLQDLVNKNTRYPVKVEFQVSHRYFCILNMYLEMLGIYLEIFHYFFNLNLKFKFNWISCILSGNPIRAATSGKIIRVSLHKGRLTSSDREGEAAASSKESSAEFPGSRYSASLDSAHLAPSQFLFFFHLNF